MKTSSIWMVLLFVVSCVPRKQPTQIIDIFCDAEQIVHYHGGKYFANASYLIANGQTRSDLQAYSGRYSSLITGDQQYGMSVKFKNVRIGDRFQITVMRKSRNHTGILAANMAGAKYWSSFVSTHFNNGWERLRLHFVVDTLNASKELEILVWMPADDTAFFDDLHIKWVPAAAGLRKEFICSNMRAGEQKYLFLGHIYQPYTTQDKIDYRIEAMDRSCFDQVWLGGDVCVNTTQKDATLDYLDKLFHLSDAHTYWALGNHDVAWGHIERITERTHRKTWYADYNNGFTVMVLNTNLPAIYSGQALCDEMDGQFRMIRKVCDTISSSSHLLVLMHHVLWYELDKKYWQYANETKSSWRASCDQQTTFKHAVYPLLQSVQAKGIQVICIAGDAGLMVTRTHKKSGFFRSEEGIQFLASGISTGKYYREQKDSLPKDHVLILYHNLVKRSIRWKLCDLDSLLSAQLVIY